MLAKGWTLSIAILGGFVIGSIALAQGDPPEVLKLIDGFERETQVIQLEADQRIASVRRRLTRDLELLQDKLTKSVKLEEAIRVRDWIRKINGFVELKVLQNPESKDYLLAASEATITEAEKNGYKLQDIPQGLILREQLPNTIPLITYFKPKGNDYLTVATQEGISSGKPDYQMVRIEGYVFPRKVPASLPIYVFWNGKDNATATETMKIDLEKQSYKQIRIEGWILKLN